MVRGRSKFRSADGRDPGGAIGRHSGRGGTRPFGARHIQVRIVFLVRFRACEEPLKKIARRFCLSAVCGTFLLIASCGGSQHPNTQQSEKPAAPAYPPEVYQAAQKLFGAET